MLNSHKRGVKERLRGKQNILLWIIDTLVSHHVTRTYAHLSDLCDIASCLVKLPDAMETIALKEGKMIIRGKLKLLFVVFMPKLKCNLIFVS